MKNLEELKNEYIDFINRLNRMDRIISIEVDKKEEWNQSVDYAVKTRNRLFEEKHRIYLEFQNWKYKNNIGWKEIKSFGKIETVEIKWRGWDSSEYTYKTMVRSIRLTDKKEVNGLIRNMEKIINIIGDTRAEEYVEYLKILNNETRYYKNEGCMTTLALDIMENHNVYNSFKESFKTCILRISRMIDYEFLFYLERNNLDD